MGKRLNPATVGAFVLGALGLILVAVVVIKGGLLQKTHRFVIYFTGDINGLRKDAPVKFKGVEIGDVKEIQLSLGQTVNQQTGKIKAEVRIPVIIELNQEQLLSHGGTSIDLSDPHTIPNLILEGLRAQLASDSFVTGILYVKLDIEPDMPSKMFAPAGSPLQEIPAIPNTLEQVQEMATQILKKLDKVDVTKLNGVFDEMATTLTSINNGIARKDANNNLSQALVSASQTLDSINNNIASKKTGEELSQMLASASKTMDSIRPVSSSFDAAAKQATNTLGTVQTAIEPGSPVNYQILQALHDVSAAARSIKELADFLQRNPSTVIRGRDLNQH
jgi:paraquat-inducible protein B